MWISNISCQSRFFFSTFIATIYLKGLLIIRGLAASLSGWWSLDEGAYIMGLSKLLGKL